MANQRKLELVGTQVQRVACSGLRGRIAVYDKGQEPTSPPVGTVYVQEAAILEGVTLSDGKQVPGLRDMVVEIGPKTFLRGRVVTDQKEATELLMPPFVRQLADLLGASVEAESLSGVLPTVVAITTADGTEVGIPLGDKDTAPPEGAPSYPVGESPEEVAEVEAKAKAERDKGIADLAEFGLTEADYDDGSRVGNCPGCLDRHPLAPGIAGLTDEDVAVERQSREDLAEVDAKADPEWDEDFDDEEDEGRGVPAAELKEIGGESGRS